MRLIAIILLVCLGVLLAACVLEEKPTILQSNFLEERLHTMTFGGEREDSSNDYLFHFKIGLKYPLEEKGTRVESNKGFIPRYIQIQEVTEQGNKIAEIGKILPRVDAQKQFHFDGTSNQYVEIVTFEGKLNLPLSDKTTRHFIFVIKKNDTLHGSKPYSFDYGKYRHHHQRYIEIQETGPKLLPPALWHSEESHIFQISVIADNILEIDGRVPMQISIEEVTKDNIYLQTIADIGIDGSAFRILYRDNIEIIEDDKDFRYFRASMQRVTDDIVKSDSVVLRQGLSAIPTAQPEYRSGTIQTPYGNIHPEEVSICINPQIPSTRIGEILDEQQVAALSPIFIRSYKQDESCFMLTVYNPALNTIEDTKQFARVLKRYREIIAAEPNYLLEPAVPLNDKKTNEQQEKTKNT